MNAKKLLVMVAMVLAMGSYSNANLLVNGDLESGALGDLPGWFFSVNATIINTDSSGFGTKSIQMPVGPGINGQAINGFASAAPGQLFNASVDYKTLPGFIDGGGDWAFLRFWDASSNFLGQTFIGPLAATNGQWVTHSVTGVVAPAGAAVADLFVAIGLFGTSTGIARVDNAIITPEPATMLLLALGGVVALRKRKRAK